MFFFTTSKNLIVGFYNKFEALLREFFNRTSSLFEEIPNSNVWSMMRYIMWFVGTLVPGVWAYLSIVKSEMVDIPSGVLIIYAIAVGGKVGQKVLEMYLAKAGLGNLGITTVNASITTTETPATIASVAENIAVNVDEKQ